MPLETQRDGRYPERTVYMTTLAGRAELFDWRRSLLRTPATEYTQFAAALTFLGHLTPAETATLPEEHVQQLQKQVSSTRSILERGRQLGIDSLFLVEDRYTLTQLEAKLTFIQQLIQEIKDGTLAESIDDTLKWKISRPDLALLSGEKEAKHQVNDNKSNE
ncbi:MAG TPA: hypothetical protein VEH81_00580 [Ktedonobacteraceae bacterium]|nr:hypothetical protein [Ktedonobacteraceae bacterium]